MRGLLRPGSLSPGPSCCACSGCCGSSVGVCLSCPDEDWSSLGAGDPVGGELEGETLPTACTWYSAEEHTLVGTGSGRVEPDEEGTTHINWRLVTEGVACFEVTATVYTNADNDVAALGVFTDALVGIGDQGDGTAQVFWNDPDGLVVGGLVNDPDLGIELTIRLCDGLLTYSAGGSEVAEFAIADFDGVSAFLDGAGGYAVFIEASGTGQIGALDFECVDPDEPELNFLLTTDDDQLLTTDGDPLLVAT